MVYSINKINLMTRRNNTHHYGGPADKADDSQGRRFGLRFRVDGAPLPPEACASTHNVPFVDPLASVWREPNGKVNIEAPY